ncbi:MAG: MarR family transcriptional regulator [Actinomycetota bacterium]
MPDTDLARLCLGAHRTLASELLDTLNEWGWEDVRPSHAAVFMSIDRRSGTRLGELAKRARITKQGMMLIVDDLEARGYIRRVPDPDDSRAKIVRLTARGRRYVADARRIVAGIEGRYRREFGYRNFATMRRGLEFIIGIEEDEEEADGA